MSADPASPIAIPCHGCGKPAVVIKLDNTALCGTCSGSDSIVELPPIGAFAAMGWMLETLKRNTQLLEHERDEARKQRDEMGKRLASAERKLKPGPLQAYLDELEGAHAKLKVQLIDAQKRIRELEGYPEERAVLAAMADADSAELASAADGDVDSPDWEKRACKAELARREAAK